MDPFCNTTFTITTQTDIDNGPLQRCPDSVFSIIYIRNVTGTITFPALRQTSEINVQDSPQLEILDFPNLDSTTSLTVNGATSLTNISLPLLGSSSNCSEKWIVYSFNITNAPSLVDIKLRDSRCLYSVTLFGIDEYSSEFTLFEMSTGSIYTDACIQFSGLTSAEDVVLSGQHCIYNLRNLTLVKNFILRNATGDFTIDLLGSLDTISPLQVEGDMLLLESTADPEFWRRTLGLGSDEISLRRIETIGGDLNVTSNKNAHIAYDDLAEVGKSLHIINNTNCSFNFESLSTVDTLLFADNTNTMLPSLTSLEKAESIQINGLIDTSIGPNIFPALKSALNVTVNASNDDFDCSKLVSQRDSQIIHNLECVGKNNQSSSQNLNTGAWAGVGVGAGVVAIGILGGLIWVILHFRNRLRTLEREKAQKPDENKLSTEPEQMQEVCGRGIFREKPDDPLVEMPTQPAELPTGSHSWAEAAGSGEVGRAA